jgi:transcriptional antiterminator NusG
MEEEMGLETEGQQAIDVESTDLSDEAGPSDPSQEDVRDEDPGAAVREEAPAPEVPVEGAPVGEAPAEEEPEDDRAWYVIHSYSGYENKVKKNLETRIESMEMQDKIFQVVVPTEDEVEIRDGARRTLKRRVFPGYILVQMIMGDDSWAVVRNTPGVTGFVQSGEKPSALSKDEVKEILERMEVDTPRIKVSFRPGQAVRVVEGPFAEFVGTVDELNMEKGKVRVLVSFFGREVPVEMDLLQVEKL